MDSAFPLLSIVEGGLNMGEKKQCCQPTDKKYVSVSQIDRYIAAEIPNTYNVR
jgi:hypothetical protein